MSNSTKTNQVTVGILFPGEMGSSLGRLLSEAGYAVVTTLEGRGPRTQKLCREAGLEVLGSFDEVVRLSNVVFSLVTPAAAVEVAKRFCDVVQLPSSSPIYVDANSIAPATAKEIGSLLSKAQTRFVDASIHGLASRLRTQSTLYLSGSEALGLAEWFGQTLRVKVLGDTPGQASALKMLMAGMSKGLVALFMEMCLAGRELGLVDHLVAGYHEYYPGMMTAIQRLLPTYPQHAGRRGDEMKELEQTMATIGIRPSMIRGARQTITEVGRLRLAEQSSHPAGEAWSVAEVIEAIYRNNVLRQVQLAGAHLPPASLGTA